MATFTLAIPAVIGENTGMTLTGHVENGVVVLDSGTLPEGAHVSVTPMIETQVIEGNGVRLVIPIIRGVPAALHLTDDRIAEKL